MAFEIPIVADVPHFDFQVELDGTSFTLELAWNMRDEAWYLNLLTEEGEMLLSSRKVVADLPLWSRSVDPRMPAGELFAVETSGTLADPGLDDLGLGRRVRLIYFSIAEI